MIEGRGRSGESGGNCKGGVSETVKLEEEKL